MAISKNSRRVQFTLNKNKNMEKIISDFLETCIDENSKIKEILYNYIVSNCGTKLPQVTQIEVVKSNSELVKVSNGEDTKLDSNNVVTESEEKSNTISELEMNELEELSKFVHQVS